MPNNSRFPFYVLIANGILFVSVCGGQTKTDLISDFQKLNRSVRGYEIQARRTAKSVLSDHPTVSSIIVRVDDDGSTWHYESDSKYPSTSGPNDKLVRVKGFRFDLESESVFYARHIFETIRSRGSAHTKDNLSAVLYPREFKSEWHKKYPHLRVMDVSWLFGAVPTAAKGQWISDLIANSNDFQLDSSGSNLMATFQTMEKAGNAPVPVFYQFELEMISDFGWVPSKLTRELEYDSSNGERIQEPWQVEYGNTLRLDDDGLLFEACKVRAIITSLTQDKLTNDVVHQFEIEDTAKTSMDDRLVFDSQKLVFDFLLLPNGMKVFTPGSFDYEYDDEML